MKTIYQLLGLIFCSFIVSCVNPSTVQNNDKYVLLDAYIDKSVNAQLEAKLPTQVNAQVEKALPIAVSNGIGTWIVKQAQDKGTTALLLAIASGLGIRHQQLKKIIKNNGNGDVKS